MDRETIARVRWALWLLVFGVGLSLAYVVGRRSAAPAAVPGAAATAQSAPASLETADPAAEPPPATGGAAVAPPPAGAELAPPPPAPQPGGSPAAPAAADDTALRDAIARYFDEVERIESSAKTWQDPQALAKALLEQITSGDSSGFDRLIDAQRRARQEIEGIEVPEPCRDHHRQTVDLLRAGVDLLERVRQGALDRDQGALAQSQDAGRDLEKRAKDVDALAVQIKQSYGVGG